MAEKNCRGYKEHGYHLPLTVSCKREDRPGRPLFAYSPSRSGAFIRGLEPNLDTDEQETTHWYSVHLIESQQKFRA
ncbi:hypothetical protein IFM47457_09883 [Aspergillus lentulus]|nr:hypothetical protein IFM47457_09883 [Aspergillus lentulus]